MVVGHCISFAQLRRQRLKAARMALIQDAVDDARAHHGADVDGREAGSVRLLTSQRHEQPVALGRDEARELLLA